MIKDSLLTKVFAQIKEPAVIISVRPDGITIEAANPAYCTRIAHAEEDLVGYDLFSFLVLGQADAGRLMDSMGRIGSHHPEECLILSGYFPGDYPTAGYGKSLEIHSILLAPQSSGFIILQTLREEPCPVLQKLIPLHGVMPKIQDVVEAVFKVSNEPIVLLDDQLRITAYSTRFYKLYMEYLGRAIEVGRNILYYLQEDQRVILIEICERVLNGFSEQSEIIFPVTENISKNLFLSFAPIIGPSGSVVNIVVSAREKLSTILEASPDVICTLNQFGYFISVNAASSHMWGYSPSEIKGKLLADLLHPNDGVAMKKTVKLIVEGVEIGPFENRLRRADGSYIPLLWSARWDAEECVIYSVAKDLTEKQLADGRRKTSEERFRSLVQDGSDLVAILDGEGNYVYVSPTSLSVLGIVAEDFIGKNAFDFIHLADKDKTLAEFAKLGVKAKITLPPFRFCHGDGSWRWIETVITDLREDAAVLGIVANSRDITERINAQKTVLLTNERYRFVTKATSDAIWDWDMQTNKIYWGEGFQRIFSWQLHKLSSDSGTWLSLVHPDDIFRVENRLKQLLKTRENRWTEEYRFKRADGGFSTVSDRAFIVRDNEGNAIRMVGAMQDISSKRKAEQQMKLLESVITQTSDMVMITDSGVDPSIIYVNDAFCVVTGYGAEEVKGRSPRILQGEKTDSNELDRLEKCMRGGEPCQISVINYKKNGSEFWNSVSVAPVFDDDGSYSHYISIGRDVTTQIILQDQEKIILLVSEVFNKSQGLVDAMEKTLRLLTRTRKYTYSEIWTLDHDCTRMSQMCRFNKGRENEIVRGEKEPFLKVKKSQGFAGKVWKTGKVLSGTIAITSSNLRGADDASKDLTYPVCGIPLLYGKEIIGVLVLGSLEFNSNWDSEEILRQLGIHLGAEIKRKQLEQELGQIFDFAPDIIAISDFDGYFKKINPAASDLLGYTEKELMSRPFTDFLHPEDRIETLERIKAQRAFGSTYYVEERYLTSAGKFKWLAWTSHAIEDRGVIFSVGKDITDRKDLEGLLVRSNSLAKIGSWEIDLPAGTVYWSDVMKEILETDPGFKPDLNSGIANFRSDDDRFKIRKRLDDCMIHGLPWDEELEILTFKGNPKWIRTIGQAEMLDRKCIRIFGSFQDVDLRKRAEIEAGAALGDLEESEKRYSDLFHLSPLPMWVYDYQTLRFLDVNRTALAHYGYTYEEFMSMTIRDIRPAEEIQAMEDTVRMTTELGSQFYQGVFRHHKKGGEVIDVEIKSNVINFKGKRAKVILVNDITERLRYFKVLERQNSLLKEISWMQSHVVRAPLAKLMGLVTLLLKGSIMDRKKQKQLLRYIELCAAELDGIIGEITKKSENQEKLSRLQ